VARNIVCASVEVITGNELFIKFITILIFFKQFSIRCRPPH
jgi:hypothetical protein